MRADGIVITVVERVCRLGLRTIFLQCGVRELALKLQVLSLHVEAAIGRHVVADLLGLDLLQVLFNSTTTHASILQLLHQTLLIFSATCIG